MRVFRLLTELQAAAAGAGVGMQGAVELRAAVTVELRGAAAGAAVGMEEAAEAARVDALEAMWRR